MEIMLGNVLPPERERVRNENSNPNLGLLYLAAYVKAYGDREGDWYNFTYSNDVLADARRWTSIAALSCVTKNAGYLKTYCRQLRKVNPNITIVVGGYHYSALPSTLPQEADYVVVGEGEQAFLDILQHRTHQRIVKRELIDPLDRIPPPDRTLIKQNPDDWAYMATSRGCPYRCVFCASSSFWPRVRYHTAQRVVMEVEALNAKRVCFGDDLFIADRQRLRQIARLFEDERLDRECACTVRANLVDEELVGLLKQLNVSRVSFGAESGCDKTLSYLKCGSVTVEQNRHALRLLKDNGFMVNASFIVGVPGESEHDIEATLRFIEHEPFDGVELYTFTRFPGTTLYSGDTDWRDYDVYRKPASLTKAYERFRRVQRRKLLRHWLRHPDPVRFVTRRMWKVTR